MAFVNEWPTQRVDDARTVDYERNAVLKSEGGFGAAPEKDFALYLDNKVIRFVGRWDITQETDKKIGIDWQILLLRIPNSMKNQTEEIKNIIIDAMNAHGRLYKREHISRLSVEFSKQQPMFY